MKLWPKISITKPKIEILELKTGFQRYKRQFRMSLHFFKDLYLFETIRNTLTLWNNRTMCWHRLAYLLIQICFYELFDDMPQNQIIFRNIIFKLYWQCHGGLVINTNNFHSLVSKLRFCINSNSSWDLP